MTKRILIITLLYLNFGSAVAQNKIGVIDMDSVISRMPETTQANIFLKKFQDSLAQEYDRLQHFADSVSNSYIYHTDFLSPDTLKEIKRDSMLKLYQRIQNFNQFAEGLSKQKADEMFKPIKEKAMAAVSKVAKENNYNYILDIHSVLFAMSDDNVLTLVLRALDIKENTATATPVEKPN